MSTGRGDHPGLSLIDVVRAGAARLDRVVAMEQDPALREELGAIATELREAEQRSVFNLSAEVERAAETVKRLAGVSELQEGSYAVFGTDLDRAWIAPSLEAVGGEPHEIPVPIPSGRALLPEARASVVGGLVRALEWGSHMRQIVDASERSPYEEMVLTATRHLFSGGRGAVVDAA